MPTVKELQKIAKKLNIKGRHSMRKAKLELAISSHKVKVRNVSRKKSRKKSRKASRKKSRKKSRKASRKKSRKKSRKASRKKSRKKSRKASRKKSRKASRKKFRMNQYSVLSLDVLYRSNADSSCSDHPFLGPTESSISSYVRGGGLGRVFEFRKKSGPFALKILDQTYLRDLFEDDTFTRYFSRREDDEDCVFKEWRGKWVRDSNHAKLDCEFYTDLFSYKDFSMYDGIYTAESNFTRLKASVPAECVLKQSFSSFSNITITQRPSKNFSQRAGKKKKPSGLFNKPVTGRRIMF